MLEMGIEDRDKIIDILKSAPAALEAEDIEDFCTLAQYYASKTPQSFRRVRETDIYCMLQDVARCDCVITYLSLFCLRRFNQRALFVHMIVCKG